jgi:hypothetical protein
MLYVCIGCDKPKQGPGRSAQTKPFVCERCFARGVRKPLMRGEVVDSQAKIRVRSLFTKTTARVVKR